VDEHIFNNSIVTERTNSQISNSCTERCLSLGCFRPQAKAEEDFHQKKMVSRWTRRSKTPLFNISTGTTAAWESRYWESAKACDSALKETLEKH